MAESLCGIHVLLLAPHAAMKHIGSALWPKLRVLQLYGSNTNVGKTIFANVLCKAFGRELAKVHYLKPVSTGPLNEADDRHIHLYNPSVHSRCLYQFDEPVSPHIAARGAKQSISDSSIQAAIYHELQSYANAGTDAIALVETAGGVLSPAPSGSSQADLYRPLRLPVLLLGDHQLGGISGTISAWESLHLRGYDVQSVALFEGDRFENHLYLKDYFAERNVHTFAVQPPPERKANEEEDVRLMRSYYEEISRNRDVTSFTQSFLQSHDQRIRALRDMPEQADEAIWHPFMQHRERSKDTIVAMDSAYGDFFQTYSKQQELSQRAGDSSQSPILRPAFDGSASWWTQGLGHGNPQLALAAAHAAGRYGHVMFAGAIHQPALTLAQTLISGLGNPRLRKVFYTDNGSTGIEVAIKMALRASSLRNKWSSDDDILILGFTNSYHGDTIGTMDCSEPSVFNTKVEWYRGRGHWFDFPCVKMVKGRWLVDVPPELSAELAEARYFDSLEQVFDYNHREADRKLYTDYFSKQISALQNQGKKFGALILEPVLLGAGGMLFADPLFQTCLVDAVRQNTGGHSEQAGNEHDWQGMPVIFDEVFTGFYRLGRFSAASFLGVQPDIVVNAKLLTGGLIPLATTTASQAIFDAFLSDEKSDALLHGHSYTAHAVGCGVANESLSTMEQLESNGSWNDYRSDWQSQASRGAEGEDGVWSMWTKAFVTFVSQHQLVDHVFALGSVLAISLKDPKGSGYSSTAAVSLRDRLFADMGAEGWIIHSRVLGNVLYLMAAVTTSPETIQGVQEKVLGNL